MLPRQGFMTVQLSFLRAHYRDFQLKNAPTCFSHWTSREDGAFSVPHEGLRTRQNISKPQHSSGEQPRKARMLELANMQWAIGFSPKHWLRSRGLLGEATLDSTGKQSADSETLRSATAALIWIAHLWRSTRGLAYWTRAYTRRKLSLPQIQ